MDERPAVENHSASENETAERWNEGLMSLTSEDSTRFESVDYTFSGWGSSRSTFDCDVTP